MCAHLEELQYPIAKESTTISSILCHLRMLHGSSLRTALRQGQITLDGVPVSKGRTRVSPGQVIGWCEYRITVKQDNTDKARRLLTESMRAGGFRCNQVGSTSGWSGKVR